MIEVVSCWREEAPALAAAAAGHADERGPKDKRLALWCDPELPVIIFHPWRLSAGWRFPTARCRSLPLSLGCRFWAAQQQHGDAAATTSSLLSEGCSVKRRGNHAVAADQRSIRTFSARFLSLQCVTAFVWEKDYFLSSRLCLYGRGLGPRQEKKNYRRKII